MMTDRGGSKQRRGKALQVGAWILEPASDYFFIRMYRSPSCCRSLQANSRKAISPKDIRPSSPFDRPTESWCKTQNGRIRSTRDLSLVVDEGFLAGNEPDGPLLEKAWGQGQPTFRGSGGRPDCPRVLSPPSGRKYKRGFG